MKERALCYGLLILAIIAFASLLMIGGSTTPAIVLYCLATGILACGWVEHVLSR